MDVIRIEVTPYIPEHRLRHEGQHRHPIQCIHRNAIIVSPFHLSKNFHVLIQMGNGVWFAHIYIGEGHIFACASVCMCPT